MIKFSKHIKFRKEKSCIFLCNCKELMDFKVPLIYFDFLLKLEKGINIDELSEEEKKLVKDFYKAEILSD